MASRPKACEIRACRSLLLGLGCRDFGGMPCIASSEVLRMMPVNCVFIVYNVYQTGKEKLHDTFAIVAIFLSLFLCVWSATPSPDNGLVSVLAGVCAADFSKGRESVWGSQHAWACLSAMLFIVGLTRSLHKRCRESLQMRNRIAHMFCLCALRSWLWALQFAPPYNTAMRCASMGSLEPLLPFLKWFNRGLQNNHVVYL